MENKMATYIRTRDGRAVSVDEALDERGILKSGYSLRSPLMLKDKLPPERVSATDAATAAYHIAGARQHIAQVAEGARLRAIADTHTKTNPRWGQQGGISPALTDAARMRSGFSDGPASSQRAYEERIRSAWKQEDGQSHDPWQGGGNPPRNAGQSKTVGPGAMAHGVDPADDPRQNPAYVSPSQRAYEKRLSEAWKTA